MERMYEWRPGHSINIDANVAGSELEKLRRSKGGNLEAEDVVEAARDQSSPLHPAFEWDDSVAAEVYRCQQARYLCGSIRVVVRRDDRTAGPVPVRVVASPVAPAPPRRSSVGGPSTVAITFVMAGDSLVSCRLLNDRREETIGPDDERVAVALRRIEVAAERARSRRAA